MNQHTDQSFSLHNWDLNDRPVVVAVPHAGRRYPDELLRKLRVSPNQLRRLEDRYADALAEGVISAGFPVMVADAPRAWIDLNRSPDDIDTTMVEGLKSDDRQPLSAKARGGLGLVPRRLRGCGELWSGPFDQDDIEQRIYRVHEPWHAQLGAKLGDLRQMHGEAVLIDLHSMPPIENARGVAGTPAQIVIGDRFGSSAAGRMASHALDVAARYDGNAALNTPYAGGYTLDRHGKPTRSVHALQIEIDRSLYLDPAFDQPSDGAQRMRRFVLELAQRLSDEIWRNRTAIAAE